VYFDYKKFLGGKIVFASKQKPFCQDGFYRGKNWFLPSLTKQEAQLSQRG